MKTHSIDVSEDAGVRYLHFGSSWIQGAMRIARPWRLELQYTRDMMFALLLRGDALRLGEFPREVLFIGLGAGSLTKYFYRNFRRAQLTVVEINADVLAAAYHFFKLPRDAKRLHIHLGDGAEYVAKSRGSFDLIVVDGFDADGRAGNLDTSEFYDDARRRLNAQGLLVTNLLRRGRWRGVGSSIKKLRSAFGDRLVALPASEAGNTVAIGSHADGVVSLEELSHRAAWLKRMSGLNLQPTIERLASSSHHRRGLVI